MSKMILREFDYNEMDSTQVAAVNAAKDNVDLSVYGLKGLFTFSLESIVLPSLREKQSNVREYAEKLLPASFFNPETFYVQDNIEEQINIEKQAMLENMQSIPLFSDFLQKQFSNDTPQIERFILIYLREFKLIMLYEPRFSPNESLLDDVDILLNTVRQRIMVDQQELGCANDNYDTLSLLHDDDNENIITSFKRKEEQIKLWSIQLEKQNQLQKNDDHRKKTCFFEKDFHEQMDIIEALCTDKKVVCSILNTFHKKDRRRSSKRMSSSSSSSSSTRDIENFEIGVFLQLNFMKMILKTFDSRQDALRWRQFYSLYLNDKRLEPSGRNIMSFYKPDLIRFFKDNLSSDAYDTYLPDGYMHLSLTMMRNILQQIFIDRQFFFEYYQKEFKIVEKVIEQENMKKKKTSNLNPYKRQKKNM